MYIHLNRDVYTSLSTTNIYDGKNTAQATVDNI